jgi:uncharacterized Tic20 family protein
MSSSIPLPQPDEISQREKEDAMGSYFMMFAAWALGFPLPVFNLIAAFIYFFIHRKKSRFTAFHSLQSLLSQLPVTLVNVGLIVWIVRILVRWAIFDAEVPYFPQVFFVYLIFMVLLNIAYIVISIVALIKARKGQFFYMPLFGRVAFDHYYGPNAVSYEKPMEPNKPPEGF